MYKRMLVPLDGSEVAEVVFSYAKEVAGRLDMDVTLLHVSSPGMQDFVPMHQAYVKQSAELIRKQAREIQKKSGAQPGVKPVQVRGELVVGYSADEILRYAEENTIDFILIATHGRTGRKRWTLGGVANKVLGASKIPVWLVRAGIPNQPAYDQWPKKTILVPLDGSKLAESVLPHAKALAKQRGTEPVEVVLLRVCEPPTTPSYYTPEFPGVPLNWGDYIEQETKRSVQEAKQYLAGVAKQFSESNISVRAEVLIGKATDQIVDYANKNPFTLIVTATHGRSGFSRLVYGSVAASLIHGASSPLFLVRPEPSASTTKRKK